VEYSAKMIPEGGARAIPKLYGDGLLVCGDAAMMSNPVHREGSNLAMESGRLAGEAALSAQVSGGFGAGQLGEYEVRLKRSWVLSDMKKYDRAVTLLEHNPRLLGRYPQLLDGALDEFFRVDGVSKAEKQRRVLRLLRSGGGWRMIRDLLKAVWTLK
ncbi:MAG: FAD-dependent oxidoreductase, partial [Candidatus Dormibacteraceae bacterium]